MKAYERPEIKIEKFEIEDIITSSAVTEPTLDNNETPPAPIS